MSRNEIRKRKMSESVTVIRRVLEQNDVINIYVILFYV